MQSYFKLTVDIHRVNAGEHQKICHPANKNDVKLKEEMIHLDSRFKKDQIERLICRRQNGDLTKMTSM